MGAMRSFPKIDNSFSSAYLGAEAGAGPGAVIFRGGAGAATKSNGSASLKSWLKIIRVQI